MILEVAVLSITPAQKALFEAAFTEARKVISAMPGFLSLQLHRCIETDGRYLLLVQWLTVEHHMVGVSSVAAVSAVAGAAGPVFCRRAGGRALSGGERRQDRMRHCRSDAMHLTANLPQPGHGVPRVARAARQRRRRQSRSTSRAALWPGAPVTPPPGWVPAPHMYRPGSGPR